MSFIDPIRWQCRASGTSSALSVPGSSESVVTYQRLASYLDSVLGHLSKFGIRRGAVYGLSIENTFLHIVVLLALEEMGAATATLPSPNVLAQWDFAAVFADREIPNLPCPAIRVNANWLYASGAQRISPPSLAPAPNDIRRVVLTSGSTGTARPVERTHGHVLHMIAQSEFMFGGIFPHCTRILCWLGLNTGLGYRSLIDTLTRGGLFCTPEATLARTVTKIQFLQVQSMIGSPQALAEFTGYSRQRHHSYPSLEIVLATGSLLPAVLARRLREDACGKFVNVYGLTEAGILATAPVEALDLDNGEAGFVLPGVRITIIDPESGQRVRDRSGRVHVSSPVCVRGYRGDAERSQSFDDDGFFPGDNGFVSAAGLLTIHGRDSNVVNLGGAKTTLEQVESAISRAPGVNEVAVGVAASNSGIKQLVALIVPEHNWSEPAFWAYCERYIVRDHWPVKLTIAQSLPRTANGKIDRREVAMLIGSDGPAAEIQGKHHGAVRPN